MNKKIVFNKEEFDKLYRSLIKDYSDHYFYEKKITLNNGTFEHPKKYPCVVEWEIIKDEKVQQDKFLFTIVSINYGYSY